MLLIELEGLREAVEEQVEQIREAAPSCGAREVRVAKSAEERDLLWKGRKNAFGAVGRVSPTYYVQDGVVPRTQDRADAALHRRSREEVRPDHQQHFPRRRRQHAPHHPVRRTAARAISRRPKPRARRFWRYCISVGGSITGEHGVGMEKNEMMAACFPPTRWT